MVRAPANRVVAITGGARGIGLATGRILLDRGARVAIGDVDEEAVARPGGELGRGALAARLDVTLVLPAFVATEVTSGTRGPKGPQKAHDERIRS